jgi:hypothetical protein
MLFYEKRRKYFQLCFFQQDLDTSRLFASGVSVTIVEKSKASTDDTSTTKAAASKETSSKESPKVATEIGLGSDISVTLVQKKKTDSAPVGSGEIGSIAVAAAAAARTPKISVKKESELLQDPSAAKDIVQVFLT